MAGIEEYIDQAEAAFEADARKRRARQRVVIIVVLVVLAAAGAGVALILATGGDDAEARQEEAEKLVAEASGPDFEVKVRQLAGLATAEEHSKETHAAATKALAEDLQKLVGDITLAETGKKPELLTQSCRKLRFLMTSFFVDRPDEIGGVSVESARQSCRPAEVVIP